MAKKKSDEMEFTGVVKVIWVVGMFLILGLGVYIPLTLVHKAYGLMWMLFTGFGILAIGVCVMYFVLKWYFNLKHPK